MPRLTRGPEPLRGFALAACAVTALALPGCAKKGAPSGGPPDLDPPRIVATVPDSGAAGVARNTVLSVTFSEGMEPRGSGDAVELAPPVPVRQRRWAGRTLTLVLNDTLRADHTYTLFVGGSARDRHGNPLTDARTVVFTTAPKFPPGVLEGRVDAIGFAAPGTLLWCYRDGRKPDSTARDFDALGVADVRGNFRIAGLAVPATWRVWAFADLNHNRSFEPGIDLLAGADTSVFLSDSQSVASGLRLRLVNPHAPGRFTGAVLDSVSTGAGVARLIVMSEADTARKLIYEVPANGGFDFKWDPGVYHVRAYRDLDRDKAWKRDTEPASLEVKVRIEPGGTLEGVTFVLLRPSELGKEP